MSEHEEAIITCVSLTGYCVEEAMIMRSLPAFKKLADSYKA